MARFAILISRLHTFGRSVVAGCNGADPRGRALVRLHKCVCVVSPGGRVPRPVYLDVVGGSIASVWQRPKDVRIFQKTALSFVSTYKWGVQKGSKKGLFGVSASYGINRSHSMQNSPPQFSLKCGVFGGFLALFGDPPQKASFETPRASNPSGLPSRSGEGWPQGPPPPPRGGDGVPRAHSPRPPPPVWRSQCGNSKFRCWIINNLNF